MQANSITIEAGKGRSLVKNVAFFISIVLLKMDYFKKLTENSTFIVAEMSGNHNGKLESAKKILRAAKACGANAIKLQTYTADTITLNCNKDDFKIKGDGPWSTYHNLHQLYQKAFTPWEWHQELFSEAKKEGLIIFSSPFDESAVDFLEGLDCPIYKIASPEINHIPLLKKVARTKKPVILSTGLAEDSDLELAIHTLRSEGCDSIAVLKCTTSYPAKSEDLNLRGITYIQNKFKVIPGLSDHSEGILAAIGAVALGAKIIEKHFIHHKEESTVDSFFSSDTKEFTNLVKSIRQIEQMLGEESLKLVPSAKQNLRGRRSLYISQEIKKGDRITENNIKCVRPSFSLSPEYYFSILGKIAKKDFEIGDRIALNDLK